MAMSEIELKQRLAGIHIVPGQWRPIFPYEQIAWVTPPWLSSDYPWPGKDYLWLDFPEAVFVDGKTHFLSHENPACAPPYTHLPKVPWKIIEGGLAFERRLPNGLRFGGNVTRGDGALVRLEFFLRNESGAPLRRISVQTCCFLRGAAEFDAHTNENKLVRAGGQGWLPIGQAARRPDGSGRWRLGFRGKGPAVADLPVVLARSAHARRFVAMSWGEQTASLMTNPRHPCIHADPAIPDLGPGETAAVRGVLAFIEGEPDEIDEDRLREWLG